MNRDGRQYNVVHQSLIRPILVLGAERQLVVWVWALAAGLILGVGNRWAVAAGIFLVTVGHLGLVWVATKDPDFSKVYIRNLARCRQDYYPARAGMAAIDPRAMSWRPLQIAAVWIGVPVFCFTITLMLPFGVATAVGLGLGLIAAGFSHWQLLRKKDPRPTVPFPVKRWF